MSSELSEDIKRRSDDYALAEIEKRIDDFLARFLSDNATHAQWVPGKGYVETTFPTVFDPRDGPIPRLLERLPQSRRTEVLAFYRESINSVGTFLLNKLSALNPDLLEEIRIKNATEKEKIAETARRMNADQVFAQLNADYTRADNLIDHCMSSRWYNNDIPEYRKESSRWYNNDMPEYRKERSKAWDRLREYECLHYPLSPRPLYRMALHPFLDTAEFAGRFILNFAELADQIKSSDGRSDYPRDIQAFFLYADKLYTRVAQLNYDLDDLERSRLVTSADMLLYFPGRLDELQKVLVEGGVETEGSVLCIHCGLLSCLLYNE